MIGQVLRPGAPARKTLDACQAQIVTLSGEISAVERAPLAYEDVKLKLVGLIEGEHNPGGVRLENQLIANPQYHSPLPPVSWRVLAVLLGGAERVVEQIMQTTIIPHCKEPGLPRAKRMEKLDELRAKLRRLEISEETETLRLESAGYVILRRPDVNLEVLLELWGEQTQSTLGQS
jgi:hypothetical protein